MISTSQEDTILTKRTSKLRKSTQAFQMKLEITAVIKCPDDAFKTRASTVDEIAKQKKALQFLCYFP